MGVLWQNIAQRTREIGLRRAQGASAWDIRRQILLEVTLITFMGIAIGLFLLLQLPLLQLILFSEHRCLPLRHRFLLSADPPVIRGTGRLVPASRPDMASGCGNRIPDLPVFGDTPDPQPFRHPGSGEIGHALFIRKRFRRPFPADRTTGDGPADSGI